MLDPDLSPARNRTLLALMLRSLDQDPTSAHSSSDMLLTTARSSLLADQPLPTTFASNTGDGQVTSTTSIHPSRFFAQSHPLSMAKHICAICGDRASGKHYGVYRVGGEEEEMDGLTSPSSRVTAPWPNVRSSAASIRSVSPWAIRPLFVLAIAALGVSFIHRTFVPPSVARHAVGLKSSLMVESHREKVYACLEEYCRQQHPYQTSRFAKLLLRLPALRSIGIKCLDAVDLIAPVPPMTDLLHMLMCRTRTNLIQRHCPEYAGLPAPATIQMQ
uniref:NR LBD domain-containing protein n=1 Tax=Plectus sambesii TaxID=2011161 RepID=A0A914WFU6_9BILA